MQKLGLFGWESGEINASCGSQFWKSAPKKLWFHELFCVEIHMIIIKHDFICLDPSYMCHTVNPCTVTNFIVAHKGVLLCVNCNVLIPLKPDEKLDVVVCDVTNHNIDW